MTAAPPRTRHSGSKLSDVARHLVLPDGIASTAWSSVARQLVRMGIPLDPWQQGLLTAVLGKRESGLYACGIGGAVVSIPRQAGKTYTFGALAFGLWLANADTRVPWLARRASTPKETVESGGSLSAPPKGK